MKTLFLIFFTAVAAADQLFDSSQFTCQSLKALVTSSGFVYLSESGGPSKIVTSSKIFQCGENSQLAISLWGSKDSLRCEAGFECLSSEKKMPLQPIAGKIKFQCTDGFLGERLYTFSKGEVITRKDGQTQRQQLTFPASTVTNARENFLAASATERFTALQMPNGRHDLKIENLVQGKWIFAEYRDCVKSEVY